MKARLMAAFHKFTKAKMIAVTFACLACYIAGGLLWAAGARTSSPGIAYRIPGMMLAALFFLQIVGKVIHLARRISTESLANVLHEIRGKLPFRIPCFDRLVDYTIMRLIINTDKPYSVLLGILNREDSLELFLRCSNALYESNIKRLRKQKKIKIAFICIASSNWSGERLYQLLKSNPRYEVSVIVCPFYTGTPETIAEIYKGTLAYFQESNYCCIGTVVEGDIHHNLSRQQCGSPDILVYTNPYPNLPEQWRIINIPMTALNAYIPYGIMTYGGTEMQYNLDFHQLCWKIFCESDIHKRMARKYSRIGDANVDVTGYIKMDEMLTCCPTEEDMRAIWKTTGGDPRRVTKLIYAPHHTLPYDGMEAAAGRNLCQFSTFQENYQWMYQYAKQHPDTTSWVYKPHPFLKRGCLRNGLMTAEEYDAYVQQWADLPNASVVIDGTYGKLFATSDAMIDDSVSFMAEYLYVHKPMLFLQNPLRSFNDFGCELEKIHYTCAGNDYRAIEAFIDEVVIAGKDSKKAEREAFFERYLDYSHDGCMASEAVLCVLRKAFE